MQLIWKRVKPNSFLVSTLPIPRTFQYNKIIEKMEEDDPLHGSYNAAFLGLASS